MPSPIVYALPLYVAVNAQEPAAQPTEPAPAKPDTPADPETPAKPDAPQTPETPPTPPETPPTTEPPPPPPTTPEQPKKGFRGALGVQGGITGGVGPGVAPIFGLFFDLAMQREGIFAPSFRLGFDFAVSSSSISNGGSHSYLLAGGNARVCPIYLPLASTLRVGPCAGLQFGWYKGGTSDVVNAAQVASGWIAPTLGVSLDWAVSSKITLELAGGVLFPLERQVFVFAPRTILHEVPQVTGGVTIGGRLNIF